MKWDQRFRHGNTLLSQKHSKYVQKHEKNYGNNNKAYFIVKSSKILCTICFVLSNSPHTGTKNQQQCFIGIAKNYCRVILGTCLWRLKILSLIKFRLLLHMQRTDKQINDSEGRSPVLSNNEETFNIVFKYLRMIPIALIISN